MNKIAENLIDLCTQLRSVTKDMSNEDAFNTLQELVGSDIRIRYEVIGKTEVNEVSEGVKERFSHLNGLNISRVLLTSNRLKSDFTRELVRSCNGVVLEYPSWKVLSVPAPMFNPKFRTNDIINNMESYTVYEIKDGTTVTLYWHDGKWRLSSTNGFDVSDYEWMGPSTYMQALTHVSKLYPDFSLDKLNPDFAYTVGFRHNEFHPLLSDKEKMWLIQSCNLKALNAEVPVFETSASTNIGIPLQTSAVFTGIKGRQLFKYLQDKNTSAMSKYMSTLRESQPDIHYGYVLRSDSLTGSLSANSNIILESELLKQIRFLMYNLPKRRYNGAVPVTATNRLEYTILRAYLSCSTKYNFLNLFPQFNDHYRNYDVLFNKLTTRIISALRSRNARNAVIDSVRTDKPGKNNMNLRIDRLAYALVKHIEECGRINAMDQQGPNIVLDFIMDKKHLDLYYTCLFTA